MNIFDIIKNTLTEEKLPEDKKGILLLDIDDTLLKSDKTLLKIYRKLPTDAEEVVLTTDEYAKEDVTPDKKKYYDYRDFRDPKKVYVSIVKGMPLINNLKAVDAFVNGGYKLGVLTARGCEDAVAKAIQAFLKVRDENGNLVNAVIDRDDIHAVNTDDKEYPGNTDFEKKQNVLRDYARKYDYVYFIDDDPKNLKAVKALKKADPEISDKLRTIDAKKNMAEDAEAYDTIITEMAKSDVDAEMLKDINNGNYAKALKDYFKRVRNDAKYVKKSNRDAFGHLISYGLGRTFSALETANKIPKGATQALKDYAVSHVSEIADDVDAEKNDFDDFDDEEEKNEPIAKKEPEVVDDSDLGKIKARMKEYEKLSKDLENYAFSAPSIQPFAVNKARFGENGTPYDGTIRKPNLSNDGYAYADKTDRYLIFLSDFRNNNFPPFVQKAALEEAKNNKADKENLELASRKGELFSEATKNKVMAQYMARRLQFLVDGFNDFLRENKDLSGDEAIAALKDSTDFDYKEFVEFEKWFKNHAMDLDEKATQAFVRARKSANVSEEAAKASVAYIHFLNGLAKADADGKLAQYLAKPDMIAFIGSMLSKRGLSDEGEKIYGKLVNDQETANKLNPILKKEYLARKNEPYEKDYQANYDRLKSNYMKAAADMVLNRNKEKAAEYLVSIQDNIKDAVYDRLEAIALMVKGKDSGSLKSDPEFAKKMDKIFRDELAKKNAAAGRFEVAKFKKYYTPEDDERAKIEEEKKVKDEVRKAIDAIPFETLIANNMRWLKVNSQDFTDAEFQELYAALQKGKDAFFELVKTPRFSAKR